MAARRAKAAAGFPLVGNRTAGYILISRPASQRLATFPFFSLHSFTKG
jgi:hypothetical protein